VKTDGIGRFAWPLEVDDGASLNDGLLIQLRFPFSQIARPNNGHEAQAVFHFLFLLCLLFFVSC
jgi:hypothetical protein